MGMNPTLPILLGDGVVRRTALSQDIHDPRLIVLYFASRSGHSAWYCDLQRKAISRTVHACCFWKPSHFGSDSFTFATAFRPCHEPTLSRTDNLSHFTCCVTWLTSHSLLLQIRSARISRATLAYKQTNLDHKQINV